METPSESTLSDKHFDAAAGEVRRPRAILSCVACRDKKLKCDRGRPCNGCIRRNQTCRYYSLAPVGKNISARASTASELNRRLQHLEDLLIVLHNQQDSGADTAFTVKAREPALDADDSIQSDFPTPSRIQTHPQRLEVSDRPAGSIFTDREGTTYVEASHWQAVLDDIQDVREFLQQNQAENGVSLPPFNCNQSRGPALLLGDSQLAMRDVFTAALPPRTTVDRLVSRFFNSGEPGIMIIHIPTFLKEYEAFWVNPDAVSMAWLGLLYSMLCMGIFFHARGGHPLPSPLNAGTDLVEYQSRAAQCIRQSDYTKTGKYKLEALLTYLATEYFVSSDAQLGVSICLSVIVRLAMHMGVHRDSDGFSKISLFEGEMRRRAWALTTQVERLTSFQLGLPSMVDRSQCNSRLPHNYEDSDIHESMTIMPPERPESEKTVLSYVIAKSRVMDAFGDIADAVCGKHHPPYDRVIHLDAELQNARASLPAFLQLRSLSMSFTDSPTLIMQRYNLELLYLKARCVLHRQYMTESTSNPCFAGSRAICVDAAMSTLRHQADIHLEALAGGQLHQDRWFISSLTTSDFLLAAMILCLEISRRVFERTASASDILSEQSSKEIISLLEHSRQIWLDNASVSRDAGRASDAILHMLHKVNNTNTTTNTTTQTPFTPDSTPGSLAEANCRLSEAVETAEQEAAQELDRTSDPQGFQEYLEAGGFDWQSWDMTMSQNETNTQSMLVDMPGYDVDGIDESESIMDAMAK